jgi:hypothetical protein
VRRYYHGYQNTLVHISRAHLHLHLAHLSTSHIYISARCVLAYIHILPCYLLTHLEHGEVEDDDEVDEHLDGMLHDAWLGLGLGCCTTPG